MFREVYKKVNEDIKGDRSIIDRAFEEAAKPEVKKPVILRYSFATTTVAAVILMCVIFANPSLFKKDFVNSDFGESVTEAATVVVAEDEKTVDVLTFDDDSGEEDVPEVKVAPQKKDRVAVSGKDDKNEYVGAKEDAITASGKSRTAGEATADFNIAVMSIDVDDDAIEENTTGSESGIELFVYNGEYDEADSTEITEPTEAESEVESRFSCNDDMVLYMDIARFEDFVNVESADVTNENEAIERAKAECSIEYTQVAAELDNSFGIWRVKFENAEQCEMIYMGTDGITRMIVVK